ncbi:MAG: hypothetical protein DSY37_00855 [Hyperthermus sp.]|nr:MAG: hypothetical protein DSY37_00855 [Hyperthermus sp.]
MIAEAIALVSLALLSIDDVKRREISEKEYLIALALVVLGKLCDGWLGQDYFTAPSILVPLYVTVNAMLVGFAAIIAWLRILGWGDVAVLALIMAASPAAPRQGMVFPTVLVTLMYYVTLMLTLGLLNALYNLSLNREDLKKLPWRYRVIYAFTAKPVEAEVLVKKPSWWYPLNICGKYRLSFNIYMEPSDIVNEVRKALKKKCIHNASKIWVSYGIPGIPLLSLAYLASLTLGDKLFLNAIEALLK